MQCYATHPARGAATARPAREVAAARDSCAARSSLSIRRWCWRLDGWPWMRWRGLRRMACGSAEIPDGLNLGGSGTSCRSIILGADDGPAVARPAERRLRHGGCLAVGALKVGVRTAEHLSCGIDALPYVLFLVLAELALGASMVMLVVDLRAIRVWVRAGDDADGAAGDGAGVVAGRWSWRGFQ